MPSRKPRLRARTVACAKLSPAERDDMWQLFRGFYADVTRAQFDRDLSAKESIILLDDRENGSLQGFSTLERYRIDTADRSFAILFSGDTIVAPEYWGQKALQSAFYRYALLTKLAFPTLPVYWFLITKGYRTYLLLSRNFLEYWPRFDRPTPPAMRELLQALARDKFGRHGEYKDGVVHFAEAQGRLKEDVAPITPDLLAQPDIRFFADTNPGHARGDELCCLGLIDLKFGLAYAAKRLGRALRFFGRPQRSPWRSEVSSSER